MCHENHHISIDQPARRSSPVEPQLCHCRQQSRPLLTSTLNSLLTHMEVWVMIHQLMLFFAQHNPRKDQITHHFSWTEVSIRSHEQAFALHMLKWFWPVESVTGRPQFKQFPSKLNSEKKMLHLSSYPSNTYSHFCIFHCSTPSQLKGFVILSY